MDLCTQLRAATDPIHAAVEALPLAKAMADGTVTRDDYVPLLQRLLAAHQAWEPEAAGCPVWQPDMARAAVIERDLLALGADAEPADHPAVADWLAAVRDRGPAAWLGVVYLFEGSRMGSLALLRPVARGLGVVPAPGVGLDYHLDGAAGRVPRWQATKAALNVLPLSAAEQEDAVWAAAATFHMLHEVYAAEPAAV